jgi:glucokinase
MLGLAQVGLVNDLEANARGIAALTPADVLVLNAGAPDGPATMALVSAGTGLGEAGLFWDGRRHHAFPSEGGHADFAPSGALQTALRDSLAAEYGHVSIERVCSGAGLENIYRYLTGEARPTAEISANALAGMDSSAELALHLMVAVYGAEAGNLALKLMATGGVWLGGGIVPKILPKLQDGTFMRAFVDKGRFRPLLESIPVRVILNDRTALLGAARHAVKRTSP